MPWTHYAALFVGGVCFANALPHLVGGILGKSLPSPFASPPFRGKSSPRVNVLWALANLAIAYWLLVHVATLNLSDARSAGVTFAGFGAWALAASRSFARLRELDHR